MSNICTRIILKLDQTIFKTRSKGSGKAHVEIDGKKVAIVDQYDDITKLFLWEQNGLGQRKHKLKLTIIPDTHHKSTGHLINYKDFIHSGSLITLDAINLKPCLIEHQNSIVTIEVSDIEGNRVQLRDFDSAGENGEYYITLMKVLNVAKKSYLRF